MKFDELRAIMAKKSLRRRPRHLESEIQRQCVSWFRMCYPQYLCFSVPNGGYRNRIEAANIKREGALAGVADLILVAEYAVLFVEMKTARGVQRESQKRFQANVERLGHAYRLCRSQSEFRETVKTWLNTIQTKETHGTDKSIQE